MKTEELKSVPQIRKLFAKTIKPAWRDNRDVEALDGPVPLVLPMYFALSRAYRLFDWDQTVPFALEIIRDLPTLPRWISQIKHFLVDEYQDFNNAEQAFVAELAGVAQSTVIVGDDDQSLYSGRGGSPNGIRDLHQSEDTDQVSLVRCYRCKPGVLTHANAFLSKMRPDARKMVPREDVEGGGVICYQFKSRKAEVEYLVGFFKDRLERLPEEPRLKDGIVCLFPKKDMLTSYVELFLAAGVPCYSRKTEKESERVWLERVLHLIHRPHQRFVERLLLEEYGEIKPRHKRDMVKLIIDRDISPSEAVETLIVDGEISGDAAIEAREFCEFCQTLSSQNAVLIAQKLAERLPSEVADLQKLLDFFIQQIDEVKPDDAIDRFCNTVLPETAQPPEDLRSVLFTTMHGSKGLTKKIVVMPGLEDAWLPGGAKGEKLDERKRLFYVALTRATDGVLITFPRTRPPGDPLNYKTEGRDVPSRFVTQSGVSIDYPPN